MIPARRRLAPAVFALSLVLLIVAQSYLSRNQPLPQGRVLFVIGLVLAGWALPSAPVRREQTAETVRPAALAWSAPTMVLAIGLNATATIYVMHDSRQGDAFVLWLATLAIFCAALLGWRLSLPSPGMRFRAAISSLSSNRLAEIVCLLGIVTLALYLRIFEIDRIPPFINSDEANFGLDALSIASGTVRNMFSTGFGDMPRLTMLPAAMLLKVWDNRLEAMRIASALTSVLTLPFLYLLARMFVGTPFALLATFMLAVARSDIFFGRYGINSAQSAVFTVAAIYLLLHCVRRRSIGDALACGIVVGFSTYSYFANRAIPIIVAGVLLFMMATDRRRWSIYVRLGLVMLATALFITAPQIGYYVANPGRVLGYTTIHLWLNNPAVLGNPQASLVSLFIQQTDRALWGFTYYPEVSEHYHAVMLDPVTGILFFLGLAVCLRRWREPGTFTLLLAYLVINLAFHVLIQGTPNGPRMTGLIPLFCLMAAMALEQIWALTSRIGGAASVTAGMVMFIGVPVLILALNYTSFFAEWAPSRAYDARTEVLRYIESHDVTPFAVGGDFAPNDALFRFFAPGKTGYMMTTWQDYLPVRQTITRTAAFIAMSPSAPALSLVRAYYPHGTVEEFRNPAGELLFTSYLVPVADIATYQGLSGRYQAIAADERIIERRDANLDFDWARQRPEGVNGEFTVRWDGSLFAPVYGSYQLRMEGDGIGDVFVDDVSVVHKGTTSAAAQGTVRLAVGWHGLRIDYRTSGGRLRLMWVRPDGHTGVIGSEYLAIMPTIHGLRAMYYAGSDATGVPTLEVIEPALYNRFTTFTLIYGQKPYVASWNGLLAVEMPGSYRFAVRAVDGSCNLAIDGRVVVSFPAGMSERREGSAFLDEGTHTIRLDFHSPTGRTEALQLLWAPPGAADLTPLPPMVLTQALP